MADDFLRLLNAPLREQVANGFRQVQADEEHIERGQNAEEERELPAERRNEEIRDAGGDEPADAPEALKKDDEASAQARRRILGHERDGDGQFAAEAETDEETEDEQRFIAPSQRTKPRRYTVEQNRRSEYLLAPPAISKRTCHDRTERHADESHGANPARLRGTQPPILDQERQDKGDQPRIHRIKEPSQTRDEEHLVVKRANGQFFQTTQHKHPLPLKIKSYLLRPKQRTSLFIVPPMRRRSSLPCRTQRSAIANDGASSKTGAS